MTFWPVQWQPRPVRVTAAAGPAAVTVTRAVRSRRGRCDSGATVRSDRWRGGVLVPVKLVLVTVMGRPGGRARGHSNST
jgi:hypothetical protein